MNYFDTRTHGEVLSRVTNDVDTLGQSLNQSATQIITSTTTIIGVLVMMLSISPLMTLVALLILPVSLGMISFVMKHSQKYFKGQQEYLGNVNGQVEEVYSGHNIVKAFNKEKDVIEEFEKTNDKLYDSAWKSQFLSGMMMPIMQFVGNLGYVGVVILGGVLAAKKTIEVGDIQSFIQYVRNFTQPIQQLAQVANMLQSTAAASERVFEFLEDYVPFTILNYFGKNSLILMCTQRPFYIISTATAGWKIISGMPGIMAWRYYIDCLGAMILVMIIEYSIITFVNTKAKFLIGRF